MPLPKGLKNNSTKKIKTEWDQTEFDKNAKKLIEKIPVEISDILVKTAPIFVSTAARWTPPSMGKSTIEKKFYERPYLILARLVKGGYAKMKPTKEDVEQYKRKMVYKVLDTRKGKPKGTAYAYCKTKGELKRLLKIETRGLARVMWGTDLESIGAQIPSSILRLIKKAQKLKHLNFNEINISSEEDETTLNVINSAKNIDSIASMAKAQGFKKIMNAIMKELKKLVDKDEEL